MEERNGESPSRDFSGGIGPNLMHLDKNEGRRVIVVRFKRRSLIRRLLASDHPLKAASSGTGLALAPLEIFCGQSFVSISTPEKTLIGFSPRLLGHSKVDQI